MATVDKVNDNGSLYDIADSTARGTATNAETLAGEAKALATTANNKLKFNAKSEFPVEGTSSTLYIATDENKIYVWNSTNSEYDELTSSADTTEIENRLTELEEDNVDIKNDIEDIEEDIETIKEDYVSKEELQSYDTLEDTDNLPLTFTTNGESLIDYKIYGNDNSNHIDEVTNNLPITIPNAKAGIVEDWRIDGNNTPQVENITDELPITFPSNGDNITDYTIYGNNNPCEPEQTSVLPITFETVEDKLRDWEIRGNDNVGENLFDGSIEQGGWTGSVGVETSKYSSTTRLRCSAIFDTLASNTYSLTCYPTTLQIAVIQTDANGIVIQSTTWSNAHTINNLKNCVFMIRKADNTDISPSDIEGVCIVKGSTAPDQYIPYQQGVGERTENLCELTIANCGIDGNGTLTSSTAWQMICAPIVSGAEYTIVSDNIVYGFYTSKPEVGSTAYNSTRYAPGGTTKTFTAAMTGWIAIRIESGKNDVVMLVKGSTAPSTYVPYGYEIPISTQGKNLFDISKVAGGAITVNGSTFAKGSTGYWYDIFSHTNGSGTAINTSKAILLDAGTYYITATVQPSSTKFSCIWCDVNGSNQTEINQGQTLPYSFTLVTKGYVTFRIDQGTPTVSNMMLVKGSTAPDHFIPYFHNDYTFYIGSTPLTAGQSISKTSTGTNITLQQGQNTISTTLYNKPEMYCGMALGVGMPTENLCGEYLDTSGLNSSGEIISANAYDLGLAQIVQGESYSFFRYASDVNTIYAFFANKPAIGSTSYDGSRTVKSALSGTFVAPITGWVAMAIQTGTGKNLTIIKSATVPQTYIPFGYQVPIDVTDENSNTIKRTFYIGNSRLLSGDTYTKTQAGIDIPTTSGNNIISTELYNKPNTSITYNSSVLGVGERTVNLYNPNATDVNNGYVYPGRLRPDGTISTTQTGLWVTEFIPVSPNVGYTLCEVVRTSNYGLCFYDSQKNYISGQAYSVEDYGNLSFTTPTATAFLRFTVKSGYQTMLVAGSTAPQTYVPYGYEIPISVNDTPQTFYIGDTPLTAGQSISKTSTGTDITLYGGSNTISTSLNNKPNMFISYQSGELGVGVRTANIFSGTISQGGWGATGGTATRTTSGQYYRLRLGTDNVLELNSQATYTIKAFSSSSKILQVALLTVTANMGVITDTGWGDSQTITGASYAVVTIRCSDNSAITVDDVLGLMLVEGSTAPENFIPYGYEILIRIYDGEANTENTDYTDLNFYIGNSLLSADEYIDFINNKIYKYVSSVLTPTNPIVDLPVIPTNGTNTIDTSISLYNKPTMYIKYSTDSFSRIFTTTLPTTFINHSDKVKDWVIYGNENGVGIETDNIFNGTYQNASITVNNNTYTYDTSSTGKVAIIPCEASTQYTVKKFTTSDKLLICEYTAEPQNNDTLTLIEDVNADNKTFTTSATAQYIIILVSTTNAEPDMTLVTGSTAPTSYIPYGYKIPLTVNGVEIPIYIGTSTLGANDTVSKTSTGVDIPTVDGENTITTTLTNKPTMKITKDFVTKEYIEDVANSCMNDNVEDIVENVVDDKVDKQMFFMFYSSINKNGMFRGKDLTNVYTVDEIYQKVSSGTFDDLYLGDYFTKSITTDIYTKFTGSEFVSGTTYYTRTGTLNNWVYAETEDTSYDSSKTYYTKTTKTENVLLMIAHFNYYYNIGDTALTNPHIILTNRNYGFATTSKMNPTNTTVDGYYNSEMHQTTLPCYAKSLKTALNNHLLSHKTLLSNAINASTPSMAGAGLTGASSSWAWYDTELQLMTEQQLFGSGIWTSSTYDVGCDGEKLAVFNFVNGVQNGRSSFWLRSVASSIHFAHCSSGGYANCYHASGASYVRPLIVFG